MLSVLGLGQDEPTLSGALEFVERGRGRPAVVWVRKETRHVFFGVARDRKDLGARRGPVTGLLLQRSISRVPQHVPLVVVECEPPARKTLPAILEREHAVVLIT